MPWLNLRQPDTIEKIISALCYLSVGLIGLLYIILSGKNAQSPFFRFHFLQSILLGILGCLLSWIGSIFVSILAGVMGLFGPAATAPSYWLMVSSNFIGHNIYLAGVLLLLYGAIGALFGKQPEIPFVSNIVRRQLGGW